MPASKGDGLTKTEVDQRRKAEQVTKHGTYAIRDRGAEAMTPAQRAVTANHQG